MKTKYNIKQVTSGTVSIQDVYKWMTASAVSMYAHMVAKKTKD